VRRISSGPSEIAVHELASAPGPTVLLLHCLGEHSPPVVPVALEPWQGTVVAMDFLGHGYSDRAAGGGYTSESLVADVDSVLADLGPATLFGRGLGGYVAILTSGCRPDIVRGVVVVDGAGIAGGGPERPSPRRTPGGDGQIAPPQSFGPPAPDPVALDELASEWRDPEYAAYFALQAVNGSSIPLCIAAAARPAWVRILLERQFALDVTVQVALDKLRASLAATDYAKDPP
jgi:pimeloyl-ACP methyl ester carboxylesterase